MAMLQGMNNEQKLKEFKRQVDIAKEDYARDRGRLDSLEKRLQDEFDVHTLEEAKLKLDVFEKEIERLTKELEDKIAYIESHYEFV